MSDLPMNAGSARWCSGWRRCDGAALLLTLFLVALIGILLTVAGKVWRTETRRDKEAELLWVGNQYATALAAYSTASSAQQGAYPKKLSELLLDNRQPNIVRHLRRLYRDPITGSDEWGLVKDANGAIMGVFSLAPGEPLKQGGFPQANESFNGAQSYAAWKFVAQTGQSTPPTTTAAAAGQPSSNASSLAPEQ